MINKILQSSFVDKIFDEIVANPVASFFAVFGILLSAYLYFRDKEVRSITYAVRSVNLVSNSIEFNEDIEIKYLGAQVKNLSVAKIAIWNSGNKTLKPEDVAQLAPLQLQMLGGFKFFSFDLVTKKVPENNFRLVPVVDPSDVSKHLQDKIGIDFEYLDNGEGVVAQIFHTGKSSTDITLVGKIKGGREIKRIGAPVATRFSPNIKLSTKFRKRVAGAGMIIAPVPPLVLQIIKEPTNWVLIVLIAVMTVSYWILGFSLIRRRVPKGFEAFEEDLKA